eukprot:scaffold15024_cov124-Isochrysis_galbana.AAC.3
MARNCAFTITTRCVAPSHNGGTSTRKIHALQFTPPDLRLFHLSRTTGLPPGLLRAKPRED